MFGSLKIAMVAILITGIAGAGIYVMKLRSDNAILKANQLKLESAVADQQELLQSQKKDFDDILAANQKMNELVSVLKKDLTDLDKRLSAQKGIKVDFQAINDANHFFTKTEDVLVKSLDKYIKKESALF